MQRVLGAAEQGDEADEPLGGTRLGRQAWRGWRRRLVPARQDGRGHRLAAYRRCWADVTNGRETGQCGQAAQPGCRRDGPRRAQENEHATDVATTGS